MRVLSSMACVLAMVVIYIALTQTLTSPELTARYVARQQTRQVQAQEDGKTAREWAQTWSIWGMWGLAAGAFVGGVGLATWGTVQWQRERTARHGATEDHTTQRHLISAKRDIALAYIAQCGDPGAKQLRLGGVEGVYLPSANELVPIDVCRAELAQSTALARRAPGTIDVPHERRFKVVGGW